MVKALRDQAQQGKHRQRGKDDIVHGTYLPRLWRCTVVNSRLETKRMSSFALSETRPLPCVVHRAKLVHGEHTADHQAAFNLRRAHASLRCDGSSLARQFTLTSAYDALLHV